MTHKLALCAMALALTACAHVDTPRVSVVYCLTAAQLENLKSKEPPKVHSQLTGDDSKDIHTVGASAIRLRAYADGLLIVLGGCVQK